MENPEKNPEMNEKSLKNPPPPLCGNDTSLGLLTRLRHCYDTSWCQVASWAVCGLRWRHAYVNNAGNE